MIVRIQPSTLNGIVQAPASKSSMQRACAAALLHKGITTIRNAGHSNDDLAAQNVITQLGAEINKKGAAITVQSKGVNPITDSINCGESGLGLRMFTPLVALHNTRVTIDGSGSLLTRPMHFFDKVFPQLGVQILSNNGKLPLQVKGPLLPQTIEVDGSLSSQFLTGLLMAFASAGASGISIHVSDLKSKPYIDLTLSVMRHFGWQVNNHQYEEFYFPGNTNHPPNEIDYTVEGDWSGGAFLLVAAAIAGPVTVRGLSTESTQADKAILTALRDAGSTIEYVDGTIHISPTPLHSFQFDATDCPDLFPPLVALASLCSGRTILSGTSRLVHKESNRAITLKEEFNKLGVDIQLDDDNMIVQGRQELMGATVHSHHDHRIAMACAVAALKATDPVTILDAEAVNKSYPDFYNDIAAVGAALNIEASTTIKTI